MSIFEKIKKALRGKPVTGVALISDVEEVQQLLEEIVQEVIDEEAQVDKAGKLD